MNCVRESRKFLTKNRQGGDESLTLNIPDVPIEITPWHGPIKGLRFESNLKCVLVQEWLDSPKPPWKS